MPLSTIPLPALEKVGEGVNRPEDVVVARDGRVFASDKSAAVAEILADGSLRRLGPAAPGAPNGINIDLEGRIVIANYGAHTGDPGPLERLDLATGRREVLLAEVEGRRLTASNYPLIDRAGNIWCSHSSAGDFASAARDGRADGFIYLLRPDGSASVVAEGLLFANGLAMSDDGRFLFCAQTAGSDVVRLPILEGETLGPAERYGPQLGARRNPDDPLENPLTLGCTDGIGFDVEGNLWVTLTMANRVVAITPAGEVVTVIDDPDGTIMGKPTNVSWGGADMKDLYIGSVLRPWIIKARSPVAGQKLAHQV